LVSKLKEVSEKVFSACDKLSALGVRTLPTMGVDNISKIRNKIKRQELYRNSKIEKSKAKVAQRKERAQAEKIDPKLKEVRPKKEKKIYIQA
jgi:hypothetical protein